MLSRFDNLFQALLIGKLFDRIGFTGSTRFVATDIVTSKEYTVDGKNLSRLEQTDVTDNDVADVDDLFGTVSNTFDSSIFSLFV